MKKIIIILFLWLIFGINNTFALTDGKQITSYPISNPVIGTDGKIYYQESVGFLKNINPADLTLSGRTNIPVPSPAGIEPQWYGVGTVEVTDWYSSGSQMVSIYRNRYVGKSCDKGVIYPSSYLGAELFIYNIVTKAESIIAVPTYLIPTYSTGTFNNSTNTYSYHYSNGTMAGGVCSGNASLNGTPSYVTQTNLTWSPGTPVTLTGTYDLNNLPSNVKTQFNSQSAVNGSYTYYTVGTGSTAEIWKRLTSSGTGSKFVNGYADSPLVSNGFLFYRDLNGNRLKAVDLTPSCTGTYPAGSLLSNTGGLTEPTNYQNTSSTGKCYYQIPTYCVGNSINRTGTIINTGGYLGNTEIQGTNPSGACYQSCLPGYTGALCNSFTELPSFFQTIKGIKADYMGGIAQIGTIINYDISSVPGSFIQYATDAAHNTTIHILNHKGTKGYIVAPYLNPPVSNANLVEYDTSSNNKIQTITLLNYYNTPVGLRVSYDDKNLFWISNEGGFFYLNKTVLQTGISSKLVKLSSSSVAFTDTPDGNWILYRLGASLYKKSIYSTDVNDGGVVYLNTYVSYYFGFSNDGNFLYHNPSSNATLYKKELSSSNSSDNGTNLFQGVSGTLPVSLSYLIKETPDGKKILFRNHVNSSIGIFDKETNQIIPTNYIIYPYSEIDFSQDSKMIIYLDGSGYNFYFLAKLDNTTGKGIPLSTLVRNSYGNPIYQNWKFVYKQYGSTITGFQGEEIYEKSKVETVTNIDKSNASQTVKDTELYSPTGVFGSNYLFFSPEKKSSVNSTVNNQGFIPSSSQSVYKVRLGGTSIYLKLNK